MAEARRLYFAHHAHRSVGVLAFPEALRQLGLETAPKADRPRRRVVCVSAPLDEPLEEALWGLKQHLEDGLASECGRAFCGLPGLPAGELEPGDCLLAILSARDETAEWRRTADSFCRQGNGVVAIVLDPETPPAWNHAGAAPGVEGHPLLPGLAPIAVAGHFPEHDLPEDALVLLTCPEGPIAWTAKRAAAGLFCVWLGHAAGLNQPDFRRLLRSALRWVV